MSTFFALLDLTAPLFMLIGAGFVLTRSGRWPLAAADALTRFVFSIAIPMLLFRLMSEFAREPRYFVLGAVEMGRQAHDQQRGAPFLD